MIDAAYAIQYDRAAEADRMAWAAGNESTYLQDFISETEITPTPQSEPATITDIRQWVNSVNAKMGGER